MGKRVSRSTIIAIVAVVIVLGVGLGVLVYNAPGWFFKGEVAPTYKHLSAGGTSVIHTMLENRWKTAYRDKAAVQVDYDSTGSTKGVNGVIDKKYAIGFTHAPITEEQRKKAKEEGGEIVQVPVLLCAVVPVYNLKELKGKAPLKFTGEVLANIFLGNIKWWDDEPLKQLNADVSLPHKEIKVVHRKDSSGTTLIFSEYLADASTKWHDKFGKGKSDIDWLVGDGKERSEGVAEFVRRTEGAIGYMDLLIAARGQLDKGTVPESEKLSYGAVQNKDKDKEFIHVESKHIAAAGQQAAAKMSELLNYNVTNMPGKDSYPICGVVWAVAYRDQPADRKNHVVDFLRYATHDGQKFAKVSFAPLPEEVVQRVDAELDSIKGQ
jgi:phosphate transport system substrate-binding protein